MFSPIMHAVVFLFVAFVFCTCSVAVVIDTRLRDMRKYIWGLSFLVSTSLFLPLPWHLIRLFPLDKNPLSPSFTIAGLPAREIRGPLANSRLDKVIADWAEANAYQPSQHRDWRVSEGDKTIGQVRFLELRPRSAFDGLHIALGGLAERPLPELNITCVSTDEPAEAFVSVDAGFITKDTRKNPPGRPCWIALKQRFRPGCRRRMALIGPGRFSRRRAG